MNDREDDDIDRLLTESGVRWRSRLRFDETDVGAGLRGWTRPRTRPAALISAALSASVLAVVLGIGFAIRGGSSPSLSAPPSASVLASPAMPPAIVRVGDPVAASGFLVFGPDLRAALCTLAIANETNMGCVGPVIAVKGLGPNSIPGYEPFSGATRYLTIRGTWTGERIEEAAFVRFTNEPGRGRPSAPCTAPADGWRTDVDPEQEAQAASRLAAAVAADPTRFVEPWLARASDGTTVQVVGTVADVAAVRRELASVYPFNLCVVVVDFSSRELRSVVADLRLPDYASASVDPVVARVVVSTTVFDQAVADTIAPFANRVVVNALVTRASG